MLVEHLPRVQAMLPSVGLLLWFLQLVTQMKLTWQLASLLPTFLMVSWCALPLPGQEWCSEHSFVAHLSVMMTKVSNPQCTFWQIIHTAIESVPLRVKALPSLVECVPWVHAMLPSQSTEYSFSSLLLFQQHLKKMIVTFMVKVRQGSFVWFLTLLISWVRPDPVWWISRGKIDWCSCAIQYTCMTCSKLSKFDCGAVICMAHFNSCLCLKQDNGRTPPHLPASESFY